MYADLELSVENPPSDVENQGEWCMIPHVNGKLYKVNTFAAMNEPIPHFQPSFEIRLELFTLNNIDTPQRLNAVDVNALQQSHFNSQRPTRFVTHGWRAGSSLTRLFTNSMYIIY